MKYVYLLLSLFLTSAVFSQNKISGYVINQDKEPAQATVILKLADKQAKTTVTDKAGAFLFENISEGSYTLEITSLEYAPATTTAHAGDSTIQVKVSRKPKMLTGVSVTANKPFIEQKIDRTVVNVDASPSNAGATALELLEKSPGISVDNDGNISMSGKQGVIVMMDGKPTYLSPADLANVLKNMPASALDQIEIMTNPSSKYDASGNSGMINIKTKKSKAKGSNGSITAGENIGLFTYQDKTQVLHKPNVSVNYNYKKNKINLFGNFIYNYREARGFLDIVSKYYRDGKQIDSINNINTLFRFRNNNYTLKTGIDFQPDNRNTFGIVLNGFLFAGRPRPLTQTTYTDLLGLPFSRLHSETINKISWKNFSGNFNYKHVYDSTGELTLDLDYSKYENVSDQLLSTGFFDADYNPTSDSIFLRGHLPSDISIYSVKSDYSKNYLSGWRLETGIKSSYVKSDNVVDYNRNAGSGWKPDTRNNHFIYTENINAAYVNLNKSFKKWSLQSGIRLENTNTKGVQVVDNSTVKRNYISLFPSVFISRPINPKHTLTLSAGRRLQRPNYQDLNPFTFFLDSLSYKQGNPYLTPQFSYNFELTHTYKNKINTTINYTKTEDAISQIINRKRGSNNEIIGFLTSDNIANYTNIGLAINVPVKVAKWWTTNLYGNIYRNHYEGTYIDNETGSPVVVPLDLAYSSFTFNVNNNFTITKSLSAELSGWYRYKTIDQLSLASPMGQMNMGLVKSNLLKGKGTLRLSVRDPFNWQKWEALTRYGTVDIHLQNRWDNRQYGASFTYKFGKQGQQRRRASATEEEQQRVGAGNN